MLLAGLTNGFVSRIEQNPAVPEPARQQISAAAAEGIDIVPAQEVERLALDAGLPASQAETIAQDYGDAQLEGLKRALFAVGALAFLSLWFTRKLPRRPIGSS